MLELKEKTIREMLQKIKKLGIKIDNLEEEFERCKGDEKKLDILKEKLLEYDILFKVVYFLEKKDEINLDSQEIIKDFVNKVLLLLDGLNKAKNLLSDELLINKLYNDLGKFAYELMKLEMIYFGSSSIFKEAITNPYLYDILNDLLKEEVQRMPKDNEEIRDILKEIESNIYEDYLIEDVIFLVLERDFIKNSQNSQEKLLKFLEEKEKMNEHQADLKVEHDDLEMKIAEYNNRHIKKKIASLLITLSLIGGLALGGIAIYNDNKERVAYESKKIVYSIDSREILFDDVVRSDTPNKVGAAFYQYGLWKDRGLDQERTVISTDLSNNIKVKNGNYEFLSLNDILANPFNVSIEKSSDTRNGYNKVTNELEVILSCDEILVENQKKAILKTLAFCFGGLSILFGVSFACKEIFGIVWIFTERIKKSKTLEEYQENVKNLENVLNNMKSSIEKEMELNEEFIKLYEVYKPFFENEFLDEKYKSLIREKYNS